MRFFSVFVAPMFLLFSLLVGAAPAPNRLEQRDGGRGTWFHVGLGACGQTNQDSDLIIAISSGIYGNGEHCNQQVAITANGITAYATVEDECPSCADGDLDMSPGLFEQFASLDVGVLQISWNFT